MTTVGQWIEGARPRTLPAAVAPVVVGTGAAAALPAGADLGRALLALLVALALQVGVNYANDYSDGVRGTDDVRAGPLRLTATKTAAPAAVRNAALIAFAIAAVLGLVLVALTEAWWLLLVGAAAIAAAWFYTGGKRPYGYLGLGEVFVFLFFGLVAVVGTTYTQAGTVSWETWTAGCGIGVLACALLVVNNLRDIPTDATTGKRTLAVRLGDARTRTLYLALIGVAMVAAVLIGISHPVALAALLSLLAARSAIRTVRGGAVGMALIPVLRDTARTELVYAVLLALGFATS
jgi:1,4-dihydroxy-2-naphthoate octaprenyltransferase